VNLTSFYPETASMPFRGVEKKKRGFSFLAISNAYVFKIGSTSLCCSSAQRNPAISGWPLTDSNPETASMPFRGVEKKKRGFSFLAISNAYVFEIGSTSLCCTSTQRNLAISGRPLTGSYPETASMPFRGVEKKKRGFSFLAISNAYVFEIGSTSLCCTSAQRNPAISGRPLTGPYPETASMPFRGVEKKKRGFSLLASFLTQAFWLFVITGLLSIGSAFAGPVYKYQEANGRWRFADKPPRDKQTPIETLVFEASPENPFELKFDFSVEGEQHITTALNPFHIPIEIKVQFANNAEQEVTAIIPGAGKTKMYSGAVSADSFRYRYVWGTPSIQPDHTPYRIPISSPSKHKISQGFNGRFSHNTQPNLYAIDIGLPIGTDIVAARAGTVFMVNDDYAFGGAQKYFIDKANSIHILHSDGTYATYAHLLLGSAVVKPGQIVEAGDLLAQSGSSGFSTGPHLHFVVRKNAGFRTESIAFKFENAEGAFTPRAGQELCPCE
jgi:murein DD-endopeptidase MepM/ murein hydrolase activator NlpD